MAILDLVSAKEMLQPGQCLLGIDLGSLTIGMAVSDVNRMIASPLMTFKRGKFRDDLTRLMTLFEERSIGGIILGLPISMDGTEGPRCQATRQFANNLMAKVDLPLTFWDERLSTAAVERVLVREADMPRKKRGKVVDKMAAAYILQGALDAGF